MAAAISQLQQQPRPAEVQPTPAPVPQVLSWGQMSQDECDDMLKAIVESMDIDQLGDLIGEYLQLGRIRNDLVMRGHEIKFLEDRAEKIEGEFNRPGGAVVCLQEQLEEWEKRRDSSSSTCGGYTFRDQEDVEAMLVNIPDPEVYRYFLDVFSYHLNIHLTRKYP